ncbi:hypothetical protein CR203_09420 [Salipaludibacillus neizhouensis]|uniref:Uncharacterized protein n=1 Tax=Salipaludibacillus neizhouensis TaxID=885475 RepID=A0A3A9K5N5_9BACI|nr:hypothetical protein [Salipaludibacillus neizhouensis]RKL67559.1 hypothetical protein CR203_09420 [Salipaludibacillus neizhouensis]
MTMIIQPSSLEEGFLYAKNLFFRRKEDAKGVVTPVWESNDASLTGSMEALKHCPCIQTA